MLDIAGVSASLLDTDPVFDRRKIALAWHLLEKYLELIDDERSDEIDTLFVKTLTDTLIQTAHWRKDNRIRKFAEKIRIDGSIQFVWLKNPEGFQSNWAVLRNSVGQSGTHFSP